MTTSCGGDRGHDASTGITAIMAETVADVRLPNGLLDRAVARNRKRSARNRLIAAAGTAAAAAIATAVLVNLPAAPTAPGQAAPGQAAPGNAVKPRPGAAPRLQTDAYILARASAAQLNSRKLISVTISVGGTMYTDVSLQRQRYLADLRAKDGQPYFEWADQITHGTWTETMVVNQDRVYSIQSQNADGVRIGSVLPLQEQSDPMAAFYIALKKHQITVVGHRDLNGRDTILLQYKLVYGRMPSTQEAWIDARTYLVVQTRTYKAYFKPLKNGGSQPVWRSFITTVSWLEPTKANLAKLSVAPPPGYARVPATDMVKYLGPIS